MGHYHGRSKPYHRQYKKEPIESKITGAILFGIGKILSYPFRRKKDFFQYKNLDHKLIKSRFLEIEELIRLGTPSNLQKALLEADKLIDYALKGQGYQGESMAERLRSAKSCLSNYQDIWFAHKLRNQIVHETDTEILSHEIKKAVRIYKKALQNLKVL